MNIWEKLAKHEEVTNYDIALGLREICENVHSSCSSECPVFEKNGGKAPNMLNTWVGCDCFGDGKAMLAFLRRVD